MSRDAHVRGAILKAAALLPADEYVVTHKELEKALAAVTAVVRAARKMRAAQRDFLAGDRSKEAGKKVGLAAHRLDCTLAAIKDIK